MKIKFNIKREVQISPEIIEEKINNYLKKNYYRIVEQGPEFIIFVEDEYSERKRYRSDYHTRLDEGKFEFHPIDQDCAIKLTYLTSVTFEIFIVLLFGGVGVYINSLGPMLSSCVVIIPFLYKIYYLNEHVFDDVLKC